MKRRYFLSLATATAIASRVNAQAQFPEQAIKWVVPYPAGGGTDSLARAFAESMRIGMGQPIVIDNRPGAATNIGAEIVARARPDGYTVMSADNALLFLNEHLFRKLPVNPEKDFTYIAGIGKFPLVIVVHADFPARDFKAFLAHLKANPGKVNYANPGNGTPHHLAMELLKSRAGVSLTGIPYRGAAPALQDVLAGQVPVMYVDLPTAISAIRSGKVRALAIGSPERSAVVPEVPTLAESGVMKAEVFALQGLVGPVGLPAAVVSRLNLELNKALSNPAVVRKFTDLGFEPLRTTPEQFKSLARSEAVRWGEVIRSAGVSLD